MNHVKIYIIIIILLITGVTVSGQSTQEEQNPYKDYFTHSPRKASIYSAILPGLGQAYNKKYWKIPVVYTGIGAFTYLALDNNKEFNRYKNAYIQRTEGLQDEFLGTLNDQALLNEMDRWRKFRDYCIIGVTVIYVLQIVDANVDANLYNFDVSDDLSLRLAPSFNNNTLDNKPNLSLKLVMTF